MRNDRDLERATTELEELKQREQSLLDRETQLSADKNAAEASVADLNSRPDALEREIMTQTMGNAKTPERKQQ